MGGKAKGSSAERELVAMLWGANYAALRAAGSGVTKFYCPDIIASNGRRVLALECKCTKHKYQYFEHAQIRQLLAFSKIFRAEPWLAVKFSTQWRFFKPSDLKQTGKALVGTPEHNSKLFADLTDA